MTERPALVYFRTHVMKYIHLRIFADLLPLIWILFSRIDNIKLFIDHIVIFYCSSLPSFVIPEDDQCSNDCIVSVRDYSRFSLKYGRITSF